MAASRGLERQPAPTASAGIAWGASHWRVICVLYFAYFANIFGRTAVQVAIPVLQGDPALHFTHQMTASLLSLGAVAQVAGKTVGTAIMTALGPVGNFSLNLLIQVVSYTLMALPFGGTFVYPRYLIGWMGSMWAASTMHPCMTAVASDVFEGNGFGRAQGILSTSSRAGAILGNMFLGPLSTNLTWQALHYCGAATAATALISLKTLLYPLPAARKDTRDTGSDPLGVAQSLEMPEKVPFSKAMLTMFSNGRLWAVYFCQTMMNLAMECQALLPLYLQQGANLSPARAGSMAAVFPFGAAGSTFLMGLAYDKIKGAPRALLFGCSQAVAVGALGMLAAAPENPSAPVLAAIMAGVAPTYYIASADFISRLAGPRYKGPMLSYMDVPGQLANIGFMSMYPLLLARGGWSLVFRCLQGTTFAGGLAMVGYLLLDAKTPTVCFDKQCTRAIKKTVV